MSRKHLPGEVVRVNALVETIRPLLAGEEPEIQGAVLSELMAIWLAGFPRKEFREQMLAENLGLISRLIALFDKKRGRT